MDSTYIDDRKFRTSFWDTKRPYGNSDMVIFKFDWLRFKNNIDWQSRKRLKKRVYADADLMAKFKIAFIDKFSPQSFKALMLYTNWQNAYNRIDPIKYPDKMKEYEKNWMFDQYEIGLDLIHKHFGVRNENHWRSWYILVPKIETEMVEWVKSNAPYYVKILSKI